MEPKRFRAPQGSWRQQHGEEGTTVEGRSSRDPHGSWRQQDRSGQEESFCRQKNFHARDPQPHHGYQKSCSRDTPAGSPHALPQGIQDSESRQQGQASPPPTSTYAKPIQRSTQELQVLSADEHCPKLKDAYHIKQSESSCTLGLHEKVPDIISEKFCQLTAVSADTTKEPASNLR
ncbi:hypothetical protein SK128_005779 [Halocaridina rubra]|uniref:Uncharacterized protein n=1 Tax=Halocaridina rubra TaxID=373956 RepID=A0AAN8XRP3_HALRR